MNAPDDFVLLLLKHEPSIRGFICAFERDAEAREDLFQETALKMLHGFGGLENLDAFAAWGRGIAANLILQNRARNGRRPAAWSPEALEAVQQACTRTETDGGERRVALRNCMQKLAPRAREMLVLRYEENLSGSEIADRMRLSLDAVHQTLSRVRAALHDCIQRTLQQDERGLR